MYYFFGYSVNFSDKFFYFVIPKIDFFFTKNDADLKIEKTRPIKFFKKIQEIYFDSVKVGFTVKIEKL